MNTMTHLRSSKVAATADSLSDGLKLKKILVPIDFSLTSRKALAYAVPFARKFGAKITFLYVLEAYPHAERFYAQMDEEVVLGPIEKQLKDLAQSAVDPEFLDAVVVREGTPYEIISTVALERDIDLIVITTHGHTGLRHIFLGSTAERVGRHAPCPVLVVREREHEFV